MNPRPIQFSLKTLLSFVTITAVAAFAVQKWRTTRIEYLVEAYLRLEDNGEFAKAADVADFSVWLYPKSDIARHLASRSETLRKLQSGEDISGGCVGDQGNVELDPDTKAKWEKLSRRE